MRAGGSNGQRFFVANLWLRIKFEAATKLDHFERMICKWVSPAGQWAMTEGQRSRGLLVVVQVRAMTTREPKHLFKLASANASWDFPVTQLRSASKA